MSPLHPVKQPYAPGYPKALSESDLEQYLRPGLAQRYSRETLLAGAIVTACSLTGCSQPGSTITRQDSPPERDVMALIEEVLGSQKAGIWYEDSSVLLSAGLKGKPPVKYPRIPIMFGNSYAGIFDAEAARKATMDLFALYGIELEPNVELESEGYTFTADGFNRERGIGFKLREKATYQNRDSIVGDLGDEELEPLASDAKRKDFDLFVTEAEKFPNMDSDLYTPMRYYLASVVDYLNWVHGDRSIDLNSILGEYPHELSRMSAGRHNILPDNRNAGDAELGKWSVSEGSVKFIVGENPGHPARLEVTLEPGGVLTWVPGADDTSALQRNAMLRFSGLFPETRTDEVGITANVRTHRDYERQFEQTRTRRMYEWWRFTLDDAPETLQAIEIRTDATHNIVFQLEQMAIMSRE